MSQSPFNFQDRMGQAGPSFLGWFRETFSIGGLLAMLKTLIWLVPLTVLIWFYAARSIAVTETVTIPVAVRSADPTKKISLQDDNPRLTITFSGPQARVDALMRQLRDLEQLTMTLEGSQVTGAVYQLVKPLLAQTDPFRSSRVQIQNVSPDNVGLFIDQFVERTVDVRVPKAVERLIQSAAFDPPTVVIRGPARDLTAIDASGGMLAEADLTGMPLLREPGKKDPVVISIRTPPGMVSKPTSVTATLEVRSNDIAYELKSVPVFASLPQDYLNNYRVTLAPSFISNVRVVGPRDQIELLQNDSNLIVRARLDFTPKELSDAAIGRTTPKRPVFELPEGVKVDPLVLPTINVEWSVQRRDTGN